MMLHEKLPDSVTVNGRRYRLDLDLVDYHHFPIYSIMVLFLGAFIVAACGSKASKNPNNPAGARAYVALKCVMKRPPKDAAPVLSAVNALLFPARKKSENREKLTDLKQDADLIRAAFLQSYGVNLWRDRLHWFEFSGLLACIPGGSRYADIIGIRARPMPEATKYNAKEREWLIKAKQDVALEMTEKERAARYDRDVANIAAFLMGMAEGSD